jgi:hypothetical protein
MRGYLAEVFSLAKPECSLTIAATDAVFDQLFRAETLEAELPDAAAREEYVERDAVLTRSIIAVGKRLFDPAFAERHIYAGDNWWPNHTRYVDASIDACTQAYFDELRVLLTGDYERWRIQVVVSGDPLDGKTMVGSIAIEADRLLVDRALYGVLVWRGMDFRRWGEPKWREPAAR